MDPIIAALMGANIANLLVNDSKSINIANAKIDDLDFKITKVFYAISKLGAALSNEIDIVKKLQILNIYGAYKTPDGNIEYKEGNKKIVFDISSCDLMFYINDAKVKSIDKKGNEYLYKDDWCYNVKKDLLYKNYELVAGRNYVVVDGRAIRDSYYDEESIEEYKKIKAKEWNKKRPFFDKGEYLAELMRFRRKLDWARSMMNMLPRYKKARAEADRMKKLVIQNSSLLEGEME